MKHLERDQYWTYVTDQGHSVERTLVIWIVDPGSDKIDPVISYWTSDHDYRSCLSLNLKELKAILWDQEAELVNKEKANMLIDLWKPYQELKK